MSGPRAHHFNETFVGLVLHPVLRKYATFQYPEERQGFQPPERMMPGYKTRRAEQESKSNERFDEKPMRPSQLDRRETAQTTYATPPQTPGVGAPGNEGVRSTASSTTAADSGANSPNKVQSTAPSPTQEKNQTTSSDLERPPADMTADDPYIVDWYGEDDPDKPQNWPEPKKILFLALLMLLTTSVYMGSSIVTPAIPFMSEFFGVGIVTTSLSLSLFVFGYGLGPMVGLCSASEIPAIGRAIPYVSTLFIFVILQIPNALVDNVAGYMILRFLSGFFGSPPLATGGASVQDVWDAKHAPLALGLWGISASAGPVLGPLVGGYAAQGFFNLGQGAGAWRWTIWPLLMLTGFTLALLLVFMPETSATNILKRRADRLRQATGNPHLRSRGELFAETMTGHEIAMMTFVRPIRLGLFEPIALAINLHIGLVYGVLYSFFESFVIVFTETYGWSLGNSGLAYLGILVGNLITYAAFATWFTQYFRPRFIASNGRLAPETWFQPAMLGSIALPISLFMFGWTSNASIHWIVPVIGTVIFSPAIFGLFTSGLNILATCYPDYVASLLSANDFSRAFIGGAMPLVSRQLFNNLNRGPTAFPVAWGCTLLGGVSLVMAPIPYLLAYYGPWLRKRSKYAINPEGDSDGADEKPQVSRSDSSSDQRA